MGRGASRGTAVLVERVILSAALVCGSAGGAFAQTGPGDRPFHGLFGRSEGAIDAGRNGQFVDLRLYTYAGFDQNDPLGTSTEPKDSTPGFYRTGRLLGGGGRVLYVRRQDRITFFAGGGTNQRYDPEQRRWSNLTDYGSVGVVAALSPRAHLQVAQALSYSPYYQLGITGGLMLVTDEFEQLNFATANYTLLSRPAMTYATDATLSYDFSDRTSLEGRYEHGYTNFSGENLELRAQDGRVMLRHKTTPSAGLHVGYGYREGRYAFAASHQPSRVHDLNLGADYARPLSFARRASVAFSVGSAVVSTPHAASQFTLVGDGNLTVGLGESWTAMASYYRGVDFVNGLADPLFVNGISSRLNGFINDRIDVDLFVQYTFGRLGLGTPSSSYSNYTGTTRVRFAVMRNVAIYAEHLYYHYGFGATAALPLGLAQRLNRQGARAGLTLWVPLIRR